MAVETRCLGDVDAMVIASPNATVNRFSSFAKTPENCGVSRIARNERRSRVQIRFIAIFKLPFKFYGSNARNKPANGETKTGTSNKGQEPHPEHPVGPAGWRNRMFQDTINTATALPAEVAANGDVLFDLGLLYSTGRCGMVDLVAAHKWFNLAALKGRVDAIPLRREVAELMSEDQIAMAQREARAWISIH